MFLKSSFCCSDFFQSRNKFLFNTGWGNVFCQVFFKTVTSAFSEETDGLRVFSGVASV